MRHPFSFQRRIEFIAKSLRNNVVVRNIFRDSDTMKNNTIYRFSLFAKLIDCRFSRQITIKTITIKIHNWQRIYRGRQSVASKQISNYILKSKKTRLQTISVVRYASSKDLLLCCTERSMRDSSKCVEYISETWRDDLSGWKILARNRVQERDRSFQREFFGDSPWMLNTRSRIMSWRTDVWRIPTISFFHKIVQQVLCSHSIQWSTACIVVKTGRRS